MSAEKYVYTPEEILWHMEHGTKLGQLHKNIIKNYLQEVEKLKMSTDEDAIKWFKENFWRSVLGLSRPEKVRIVHLKPKLLAFRPDYETATHWGAYWVNKLFIEYAEDKNYIVYDAYGDTAIRKSLLIQGQKCRYMSILGHGSPDVIVGQYNQKLLWVGDVEGVSVLVGKCVNFLSCLVGQRLVPWLIQQGLSAASAYKKEFIFVIGNYPNSYAKWFFQAHFEFDRKIIDGYTAGEAFRASQDLFDEYVHSDEVPQKCKPYLLHDMRCHDLFGDASWRLEETPPPPPPEKIFCPCKLTVHVKVKPCIPTTIHSPTEREAYPGRTVVFQGKLYYYEDSELKPLSGQTVLLKLGDKVLDEDTTSGTGEFSLRWVPEKPGDYDVDIVYEGTKPVRIVAM